MAQGETNFPLETADRKPLDRETSQGSALLVASPALVEALGELLSEARKIRFLLEEALSLQAPEDL